MAEFKCADARQVARNVLAAHDVGERLLNDVLTVVAELVSNATRHAGGVTAFSVRWLPHSVSVEVSDASAVLPCSPGTAVWVPGGFGWLLVNQLAERIEISVGPEGKTITAHVLLAERDRSA
ncbi:ATP-binding protein [Streptomyces sp. NPDC058289]|uniref:ATP-binding protein n=1 Tax=Streptomyces sp. NPDC058289 TaxID=3346425 RepID=UPI0036E99CA8